MGWTTPTSNFRRFWRGVRPAILKMLWVTRWWDQRLAICALEPVATSSLGTFPGAEFGLLETGWGWWMAVSCVFFGSKKIYGNLRGPTSSMQSPPRNTWPGGISVLFDSHEKNWSKGVMRCDGSKRKILAMWLCIPMILKRVEWAKRIESESYCWWKNWKTSCTTWDVKPPVNNGKNYLSSSG